VAPAVRGGNVAELNLNPGAQEEFVLGDDLYSAFIGGLGSGKTYAGLARGLRMCLQPKPSGQYHAPRGVVAASTYPVLNDNILPQLEAMVEKTGLANWSKDYRKSTKELVLINGSVIRLRSLDKPDWMRGPEYAWFFIEEGRNCTHAAWNILTARLRQQGYKIAGFVSSTPNGYDWMWRVFHEDSPTKVEGTKWYNAPTTQNLTLPKTYVANLKANYSGRFYEQEVEGKFVGLVEGGVFPYWDPAAFCTDLTYDPALPLYTGWDFGFGDLGVCVFLQVRWVDRQSWTGEQYMGPRQLIPVVNILEAIGEKEWTAKDWAAAYKERLATVFNGAKTAGDYGDPAGMQRNPSTGTSVITDLNSAGVPVGPVPKRPQDFSLRLLNNAMAGGRVLVSKNAEVVSQAFASHKWKLDADGNKNHKDPVHDWTSHYVDAVRYAATVLLPFGARETEPEQDQHFAENTYGHVFEQLTKKPSQQWLGRGGKKKATFSVEGVK
jgi:hypothetical protein